MEFREFGARLLVARVAAVLFNGESNENELSTDWLSKGPHRDGIGRNPKIEIDFSATTARLLLRGAIFNRDKHP